MDLSCKHRDFFKDPVRWLNNNFNLEFDLYSHQKNVLKDRSSRKAKISGRRTGKSTILCLEALYTSIFYNNKDVLIIESVPYRGLVFQILIDLLSASLPYIRSSARINNTYNSITFKNNSNIRVCHINDIKSRLINLNTYDLTCIDELIFGIDVNREATGQMLSTHRGTFLVFTPAPKSNIIDFERNLIDSNYTIYKEAKSLNDTN